MAPLAGLEAYAATPGRRERLAQALLPLAMLAPALLLLAGASAFVFGARRALLDPGVWWRMGVALAAVVALRTLAGRADGVGRMARTIEGLLFLAAGLLALREALLTLVGPAA